ESVTTRLFREGGCGVAPAPSGCGPLGHRADIRCLNERWTQSLAVDEVVPMLFRLGPDRRRIRDYFADGGDFRSSNCRTSIGVATDELPPAIPAGRRIYAFSPRRWNAETYATLRERIRQWSDASRLY